MKKSEFWFGIIIGLFALSVMILISDKSKKPEPARIAVSIGDSRSEFNYTGGAKVGVVVELKSFGDGITQDILIATVRMGDDLTGNTFVRPAYVTKSEGIQVGDRVVVHNLSQRDDYGFNYTKLATKYQYSTNEMPGF